MIAIVPGLLVADRYEVKRFVGKGGMQNVFLAEDVVLQREVALKTPQNDSAERRFRRGAIVAAKVNHPNVAKTLDYFEWGERQFLIEEFLHGADLDKAILAKTRYVDPYLAARLLHHLAKGVAASHHAGVIHRDLKPTNIMITGGMSPSAIKITDFGIATMADEELTEAALGGASSISTSKTAIGALPYMAPEGIESPKEVTVQADIWSLGAMTYRLISGEDPFGAGLKAVKKIVDGTLPEPPDFLYRNPQFSPLNRELLDIVFSCLRLNPNERPTADELVIRCGELCYPMADRYVGVVKRIYYSSWGFISTDGDDVFFNLDSVYGDPVEEKSKVIFSKFGGGDADRAHPVMRLL